VRFSTGSACYREIVSTLCCVSKSDTDGEDGTGESGSGSDDDADHSGSGGADFIHRQRSFYNPPEFDYGISFDIFSRPPVEVVTRRMHSDGRVGMTAHYPLPTDTSSRLRASLRLLSFLIILITMFRCRCCCC